MSPRWRGLASGSEEPSTAPRSPFHTLRLTGASRDPSGEPCIQVTSGFPDQQRVRRPAALTGRSSAFASYTASARRWRARWVDPATGEGRSVLFDKESDAERARPEHARGYLLRPLRRPHVPGRSSAGVRGNGTHTRSCTAHRQGEMEERDDRLHILSQIAVLPMAATWPSDLREW